MNSNYITHPDVPRCRYCKMYGHIIQNCRRIRPWEICDVKGHRTEFCRVRCVHCEGFQHRSDMCPTIYDAEDRRLVYLDQFIEAFLVSPEG